MSNLTGGIDEMKEFPKNYISKSSIKKLSRLQSADFKFSENDCDELTFVIFPDNNNGTVLLFEDYS